MVVWERQLAEAAHRKEHDQQQIKELTGDKEDCGKEKALQAEYIKEL